MKKLLFSLVMIISITAFVGCKEDINSDKLAPTLELYAPFTNDTVKYGKTVINYNASDEQGIKNINVFINGNWHKTFQPVNGALPEVSFTIDSSQIGTLFSYHLSVVDLSENVTVSEKHTGIYVSGTLEAPAAPSNPKLTELTQTTFRLAWEANVPFTDAMELWRKAGTSGSYIKVKNVHVDSLNVIDTVSYANPMPRYFYKLKSINHYGSSFSSEASIETLPDAPGDVGLLELSGTIFNIYWTKITSKNTTGLELWRKTGSTGTYEYVKSIPVTHNNVNDTVASATPKYYYKLRATNNYGGVFSDEVSSTGAPIPPPYSIVLTLLPSGFVQVAWSYGNSTINYFRVERSTNNYSFERLANLLPHVRTFVDSTVNWSAATTYYYRVVAVRGPDEAISDIKTISNGGSTSIPAPTNINAQTASSTQVNISWVNPVTTGVTVRIERRLTGASSFTDLGVNLGVTSSAGYYEDKQVVAPNTYEYRLRYTNGVIYSNYSSTATATLTAASALTAPAVVTATPIGRHESHINWSMATGAVTGYRIQRGISTFQFTTIGTVGSSTFNYWDSSDALQPNMTYLYRVQAVSLTDSASSNSQSVVMLDFDAPSGIAAAKISTNKYKITWTINRQYFISTLQTIIERKWITAGQTTFTEIARVDANTSEYIDSMLAAPSQYAYRLRAVDGGRYSEYSGEYTLNSSSTAWNTLYVQPDNTKVLKTSSDKINRFFRS